MRVVLCIPFKISYGVNSLPRGLPLLLHGHPSCYLPRYLPVYATAPVVNAVSVAWDGFLSHRNALSREVTLAAAIAGSSTAKDPTTTKKDLSPNLIISLCNEIN